MESLAPSARSCSSRQAEWERARTAPATPSKTKDLGALAPRSLAPCADRIAARRAAILLERDTERQRHERDGISLGVHVVIARFSEESREADADTGIVA